MCNGITIDNCCIATCTVKACRVHIHKVFIQGICEVKSILVDCDIFTSNHSNLCIFTYFSICLSTSLFTRCSSIFICCNLPCLVSCSVSYFFQLILCSSTARNGITIPSCITEACYIFISTVYCYAANISSFTSNSTCSAIQCYCICASA